MFLKEFSALLFFCFYPLVLFLLLIHIVVSITVSHFSDYSTRF